MLKSLLSMSLMTVVTASTEALNLVLGEKGILW